MLFSLFISLEIFFPCPEVLGQDVDITNLDLLIDLSGLKGNQFSSKTAKEDFNALLCQQLGARLKIGGGILGSGIFTNSACRNDRSQKAHAYLKVKDNGQKFELKIKFKGSAKIYTQTISIPLQDYQLEILLEEDVLDLIAFGLLENFPYVGRLDRSEVIALQTNFITRIVPEFALQKSFPKKMIFFDAGFSNGQLQKSPKGEGKLTVGKSLKKVRTKITQWNPSPDEKDHFFFHVVPESKTLDKEIDQSILLLLEKHAIAYRKKDLDSNQTENVKAPNEIPEELAENTLNFMLSRYVGSSSPLLNKVIVFSEALDMHRGYLQGLSLLMEHAPRVFVDSEFGAQSFNYQRINLGYGPYFHLPSGDFYLSPVVEIDQYHVDLPLILESGVIYGIKSYDSPTSLAAGWRLGAHVNGQKLQFGVRYENIFHQFVKGSETQVKLTNFTADMNYSFTKKSEESSFRPFVTGYTQYRRLSFVKDFDEDVQTSLNLSFDTLSCGIGAGILW